MPALFRRAAILGTGLIGGSFALALREIEPRMAIAGWDRPEVLREAHHRGVIQECAQEISSAVGEADLIYVALPVGMAIEVLPQVARSALPSALVTDACSTKRWICAAAAECFDAHGARFLGGHPMAGKEVSGVAAAEADLFRGAKYVLIQGSGEADNELRGDPRVEAFVSLIEAAGAEPAWLDASTHDEAAAIVSHLPQLVAVALAQVVGKHTDETGFPVTLAGRGLRDALRLAGSPYSVWRDIILTNSDRVESVLRETVDSLEQMRRALERVRGESLGNSEQRMPLRSEFAAAGEFYKLLRRRHGK